MHLLGWLLGSILPVLRHSGEVFKKGLCSTLSHFYVQLLRVLENRFWPLNRFPSCSVCRLNLFGTNFVVVVDLQQLLLDEIVVRALLITQLVDVMEDVMHLSNLFGWANPESSSGSFEALCLDILDLIDRVVALLSPLELLI